MRALFAGLTSSPFHWSGTNERSREQDVAYRVPSEQLSSEEKHWRRKVRKATTQRSPEAGKNQDSMHRSKASSIQPANLSLIKNF